MVHRERVAGRMAQAGLVAGLLLGLTCSAETGVGSDGASARVHLRVVVPPVFRILHVEAAEGGAYRYRVWTNVQEVLIDGRSQRFERVGESTLVLATPPDRMLVQFAH